MTGLAVDAVVPVHNAPALVRRCLESVLAHVGERLGELVVVDDASDATTRGDARVARAPEAARRAQRAESRLRRLA